MTEQTAQGTSELDAATPHPLPSGMLLPGLGYGADFNPEQWDPAVLEEDVALMREAGVTVVTVGVFSWSYLEPAEGDFRLDWLRRVLDRLHEAGIGVDLATGTASPPPWLGARHPSTLPVTADGTTLWWGSRQQYNPGSAVFRDRLRLLVERMAAELAHHPAVVAWHVGNEYACHVKESFDDESLERFRMWLQRRYGGLDALNAAWGTAFWSQRVTAWDQVVGPRAAPTQLNPHLLTDWAAFWSDTLLELFLIEKDVLRAANPEIPITTNFMSLFDHVDYWEWARHVDFVSNDSYPDPANPRAAREFAFDADLMRSLGGGRPWVQMEQVTSAVQWRPRNAAKRPGQYELWSLGAVARGADGILNFQWRQSVAGSETFHGAMVQHAGTESRTWGEVTSLGRTLDALGRVRGARVSSPVAIVWDWQSSWAQHHSAGPVAARVPEEGARAWHASLFERGHVVDLVHPESDLSAYRVVVVPALFRVTPAAAARLAEARRAGCQVVVTYLSGWVDAAGHAVLGGYLSTLGDLLGVRVTDVAPRAVRPAVPGYAEPILASVDRVTSVVRTPDAGSGVALSDGSGPDPWPGGGMTWTERVVVEDDVTVLARFATVDVDGLPAVTVRRHDSGGAGWYLATDLDSTARDHLLDAVLAVAGIDSPSALPPGVERLVRGGVTFLLNHGDAPVTLPDVHGTDVVAGGRVDGVTIGPRSAALLHEDGDGGDPGEA
jgi:beta-galactosidase